MPVLISEKQYELVLSENKHLKQGLAKAMETMALREKLKAMAANQREAALKSQIAVQDKEISKQKDTIKDRDSLIAKLEKDSELAGTSLKQTIDMLKVLHGTWSKVGAEYGEMINELIQLLQPLSSTNGSRKSQDS